jgi:hypothetical protein
MVADTGLLSWEACKPDFDGSPIYLAAVKDFLQTVPGRIRAVGKNLDPF